MSTPKKDKGLQRSLTTWYRDTFIPAVENYRPWALFLWVLFVNIIIFAFFLAGTYLGEYFYLRLVR